MKPNITVYVKSMKVPVGERLVEELYSVKRPYPRAIEYSRDTMFQVKLKKQYSYVLPDEQNAILEVVKRLSKRHGLELKIVDVAQEDGFYRFWTRLKGIKNFPAVETNRGDKLRAPFSQIELERFVSESA